MAPIVSDKPWSVIVGGGGVNLYFYRLGTATSVLSMEDIDNWWSWSKWEGCMSQNIIYLCFKNLSSGTSANHCFPLRRDYLFTFMLCHHLLKQVLEPESTTVMTYALCVANVGCIMTGSFLPWITMFSRCLNFGGALHLCFAVSERASEIPLLSYYIMVVLITCCCLRYLIIAC